MSDVWARSFCTCSVHICDCADVVRLYSCHTICERLNDRHHLAWIGRSLALGNGRMRYADLETAIVGSIIVGAASNIDYTLLRLTHLRGR